MLTYYKIEGKKIFSDEDLEKFVHFMGEREFDDSLFKFAIGRSALMLVDVDLTNKSETELKSAVTALNKQMQFWLGNGSLTKNKVATIPMEWVLACSQKPKVSIENPEGKVVTLDSRCFMTVSFEELKTVMLEDMLMRAVNIVVYDRPSYAKYFDPASGEIGTITSFGFCETHPIRSYH